MLRGTVLGERRSRRPLMLSNCQQTRPSPIPTHLAKVKASVGPAVQNALGDKWTMREIDSSEMSDIGYSVSRSLIGSLNLSYHLIYRLTLCGNLSVVLKT